MWVSLYTQLLMYESKPNKCAFVTHDRDLRLARIGINLSGASNLLANLINVILPRQQ